MYNPLKTTKNNLLDNKNYLVNNDINNALNLMLNDHINDNEFNRELELIGFKKENIRKCLIEFKNFWYNNKNNFNQNKESIKDTFKKYVLQKFEIECNEFSNLNHLDKDNIINLFKNWYLDNKIQKNAIWLNNISNNIYNELVNLYEKYKDFEIFVK